MTKVLPSTFHYFDKHYSVIDDRRIFTALLRHASIPVTMVADMVIGIAYLIFLGIKRELNEELFWEISHQQLFEYPFQQFIYFLFSTVATAKYRDYAVGYASGQWGVVKFSSEIYRGKPVVFEHVISQYDSSRSFLNVPLNDEACKNLHQFVEHIIRFNHLRSQINGESCIKKDQPLYRLFYDEKPYGVQDLETIYLRKVNELRCYEKEAFKEAKDVLKTFFDLPRILRLRLQEKRASKLEAL